MLLLAPLLSIFKRAFRTILKPKLIILKDLPANLVLTKMHWDISLPQPFLL